MYIYVPIHKTSTLPVQAIQCSSWPFCVFTRQVGVPNRQWLHRRLRHSLVIDIYAHYQAYAIVACARCDSVENTATSFGMPAVPPHTGSSTIDFHMNGHRTCIDSRESLSDHASIGFDLSYI